MTKAVLTFQVPNCLAMFLEAGAVHDLDPLREAPPASAFDVGNLVGDLLVDRCHDLPRCGGALAWPRGHSGVRRYPERRWTHVPLADRSFKGVRDDRGCRFG